MRKPSDGEIQEQLQARMTLAVYRVPRSPPHSFALTSRARRTRSRRSLFGPNVRQQLSLGLKALDAELSFAEQCFELSRSVLFVALGLKLWRCDIFEGAHRPDICEWERPRRIGAEGG